MLVLGTISEKRKSDTPRHAAQPRSHRPRFPQVGEGRGWLRVPKGEKQGRPALGLAEPCCSHPRAWGTHGRAPRGTPLLLLFLQPGWPGAAGAGHEALRDPMPGHFSQRHRQWQNPCCQFSLLRSETFLFYFCKIFCKGGMHGGCALPVLSLLWRQVRP